MEAKPLLYKRRESGVFVKTVPTPQNINFVFENRAEEKRVLDITFQLSNLLLEEATGEN